MIVNDCHVHTYYIGTCLDHLAEGIAKSSSQRGKEEEEEEEEEAEFVRMLLLL